MSKPTKKQSMSTQPSDALTGWQKIAEFLGEPVSVVQRWATEGMPLRREGRLVSTTQSELNAWLGKDSGKPVHVATAETDLAAELKRGLSFVRKEKKEERGEEKSGAPAKGKRK
jgi:hypothetical protein